MKWILTFFWILVFILIVLFSIQNKDTVTLRLVILPIESYQWVQVPEVPLPLFFVVLCSVFLGFLMGSLGDFYKRFQLRKNLRQNQKKIEKLEREIQSLKGPGLDQPSFLKADGLTK